ncbi:LLM class flavin-dependent oxidoreductase [Agromyces sp. MMS24-JH15]|uniref:LLM class flavin-dependent oxidoreductase n=1 Tax=Agromyces sp. MMS24-JH15 TaxID=3243765 RepID=UPI00374995F9
MTTSFGFTVSQRASLIGGDPLKDLIRLGAQAEQSEFIDTIWVGDSLTVKPRPDAIVLLGALASLTERVRLGVACMATFPVRDPIQFALQWSSLDNLSDGRSLLAVCNGTQKAGGGSEIEGGYFGGITDPERPLRLEENIRIVRALWTGETVDFDGEFTSFRDLRITPTVQQPAPIWIAGMPAFNTKLGDRFFERVARYADGYQITTRSASVIAAAREQISAAFDRLGLPHREIPIAAYTGVAVGEDRAKTLATVGGFLDGYYGRGAFAPERLGFAGAFGSLDETVEQLVELVESGVDHISLRLLSLDTRAQFDLLVSEVLPAVAAATPIASAALQAVR